MIKIISISIIPFLVLTIFTLGIVKKVPIYEEFTEGAKDGFKVAVQIIPYLVAIIVAVSMFRASGAIDFISELFAPLFEFIKLPVDALPLVIVRSLSGGAALGVFSDIANNFGPDAYITKLTAVMLGSSETTFYVVAVYFSTTKIKKLRYVIPVCLLSAFLGSVLACGICKIL